MNNEIEVTCILIMAAEKGVELRADGSSLSGKGSMPLVSKRFRFSVYCLRQK